MTQTGGKHVIMHPPECVGEHIGSGMAAVHQTINMTVTVSNPAFISREVEPFHL